MAHRLAALAAAAALATGCATIPNVQEVDRQEVDRRAAIVGAQSDAARSGAAPQPDDVKR